ncbi:hypothetical protein [Deinococcus fonticola]|uniref:hypothetical protein n=1 Tax=Deinococcus fonticola TaxID=2528713 RepID=UPI0010752775|nr:hypothetical protein [Deinococcus fonticola]
MTFSSPALDRLRAARAQAGVDSSTPSAAQVAQVVEVTPAPLPAPRPPRPVPPPSSPPAERPVRVPPKPRPSTPPRPQATPSAPPEVEAPRPLTLAGLPQHLARMVEHAQRGELPGGVHLLAGGLVMDLNGYVLAWGECWPRDPAHILDRLGQAYDVLRWTDEQN